MVTEAQKRAIQKYREKVGRVQFNMDLNPSTEQDLIKWIQAQPDKRGAVKRLIRAEIEREKLTHD